MVQGLRWTVMNCPPDVPAMLLDESVYMMASVGAAERESRRLKLITSDRRRSPLWFLRSQRAMHQTRIIQATDGSLREPCSGCAPSWREHCGVAAGPVQTLRSGTLITRPGSPTGRQDGPS